MLFVEFIRNGHSLLLSNLLLVSRAYAHVCVRLSSHQHRVQNIISSIALFSSNFFRRHNLFFPANAFGSYTRGVCSAYRSHEKTTSALFATIARVGRRFVMVDLYFYTDFYCTRSSGNKSARAYNMSRRTQINVFLFFSNKFRRRIDPEKSVQRLRRNTRAQQSDVYNSSS